MKCTEEYSTPFCTNIGMEKEDFHNEILIAFGIKT